MNELYLKVLQYFLLDVNYNKKYVKTWYIKLFFQISRKYFRTELHSASPRFQVFNQKKIVCLRGVKIIDFQGYKQEFI